MFHIDDIINLDTQKLQTEVTRAKIVQENQEYLLTWVSSQETAVLPEDKMQWLVIGVSITPQPLQSVKLAIYHSMFISSNQPIFFC